MEQALTPQQNALMKEVGPITNDVSRIWMNISKLLAVVSCLFGLGAQGQELVPNGSFENYNSLQCLFYNSQAQFATDMQDWKVPTQGTTDLFSTLVNTWCYTSCFSTSGDAKGFQQPRTGDLMSAVLTYGYGFGNDDYREYLKVQLISPLVVGQTYSAEMYVSLADYSEFATNNIGMYFTTSNINNPITTVLNFTPQVNETTIITDSINWVLVSGTFVATTAASYLIIGNFYDDASTNTTFTDGGQINCRYFIDDVSVMPFVECMTVSNDTTICENGTADLWAISDSFIGWADEAAPTVILSTDSSLAVSPPMTTTYLAYSSCDTLMVTVSVTPSNVDLGSDTTLCIGDTMVLDATSAGAAYLWQDGSMDPTFLVSGPGDYWVVLEVSNCIATDTIEVAMVDCTECLIVSNDETICGGETADLDAISTSFVGWALETAPTVLISTDPDLTVSPGVTSTYLAYASCDTLQVTITVIPSDVDLGNDVTLCEGETLELDATIFGANYTWQDGSTDPVFLVADSGVYWVVVDVAGCIATDTVAVQVEDCPVIPVVLELPNVITPNSDGSNDAFIPIISSGITTMNTTIYNRWGNIVFETKGLQINWRALDNPDGTYYWIIDYTNVNGRSGERSGHVTVLR